LPQSDDGRDDVALGSLVAEDERPDEQARYDEQREERQPRSCVAQEEARRPRLRRCYRR
jgi:hypothetical protein